jgi:hypothetical protein
MRRELDRSHTRTIGLVLESLSCPSPAGTSTLITVASGTVRLNRQFELEAADTTTILLDLDGDRSIVETGAGTYVMTPVVGIVSVQ